jgi:1-acyl-sn-glycerol-3-phosphate acyltransferase
VAKLGLDYPTDWARGPLPRAVRRLVLDGLIVPFTKRRTTMTVLGLEHLPDQQVAIFTANHTSHLDTPLVLAALGVRRRRTVVAGAVDTFFLKARKAFITVLFFNVIPIERHKVNRRSAEQALALVKAGWNLLIYPEGGRTPTGPMLEFKGGAAYLSERSGAPVVPTFLLGAGEWMGPKYAKAPIYTEVPNRTHSHVTVAFGAPLYPVEGENLRRFGERVQQAVVALARATTQDPTWGSHLD